MLSHQTVWAAIDALAARYSLSASGLAKRAGLDSTAFNKSKRLSADGRPRWPSTESIAKIIEATGSSVDEFLALVEGRGHARPGNRSPVQRRRCRCWASRRPAPAASSTMPAFPAGHGWDLVELPAQAPDGAYALQVQGDSMLPLYRDGDVLIVEPTRHRQRGDRVVVKTTAGEVMAKVLSRRTTKQLELISLNPAHPDCAPSRVADLEWIARIVWASQ